MSTRVTSAIASRKARENLIRLLFPKDAPNVSSSSSLMSRARGIDRHSHSRRRGVELPANGATGNNKRHSYSQLRTSYLQKVHAIHPDKVAHRAKEQYTDEEVINYKNSGSAIKDAHLQFIELKHAWEEYHASVRIVQRHTGDGNNSNTKDSVDDFWEEGDDFTMFGVGCSFADSPAERDLRNEIMDQACRGWFSSGSISPAENRLYGGKISGLADDVNQCSKIPSREAKLKLSDDDMFVRNDEDAKEESSKKKNLVQNGGRFRRKR